MADSYSTHKKTVYLQIDIKAYLTSMDRVRLGHKGMAIMLDLLMFACQDDLHFSDPKKLCRLTSASEYTFLKLWPKLKTYFEDTTDGGLRLKPLDFVSVRVGSTDRVNLTHLLPELVAFWGNACVYCGDTPEQLEVEHIVPVARGGCNDTENLTVACKRCNTRKHTLTAAEFGHPHIHSIALRRN